MSEYNLCSLLVHSQAEKMPQLQRTLQQLPGTEVHANTEDNRLIVTLEADSRKIIAQQILDIQQMKGVLSAAMIYQFSDDLDEEINGTLNNEQISKTTNNDINEFKSAAKRMNA